VPLATELLAEAGRQMTVCNACRYCEGICAVFPAMERRRAFAPADLDQLANLCHGCGACYFDCQYASPHPFAVNVPETFDALRRESWARYAWPSALAPMLERSGLAVTVAAALGVAGFILGSAALVDPAVLFGVHTGPGAFYRVIPHGLMVLLFGAAFGFACLAMAMSVANYWRATGGGRVTLRELRAAFRSAATLRNLEGGGAGCMNADERADGRRRFYHHLTFYGFLLCFASTSLATVWHYVVGHPAPYAWYEPVVLLGIAGGVGLVAGPIGLWRLRRERHPRLAAGEPGGMDDAFLWMLVATSVTGFLLLGLRATPAMGVLLAVHLGVVFAFFLTLPYSRFMHGLYRTAALVRDASEAKRPIVGSE
jgi:citrate/tricarballylate utilization protein